MAAVVAAGMAVPGTVARVGGWCGAENRMWIGSPVQDAGGQRVPAGPGIGSTRSSAGR